jgi:hypothetical protein
VEFLDEKGILVILGLRAFWSFDEWVYFSNLIIEGYFSDFGVVNYFSGVMYEYLIGGFIEVIL